MDKRGAISILASLPPQDFLPRTGRPAYRDRITQRRKAPTRRKWRRRTR